MGGCRPVEALTEKTFYLTLVPMSTTTLKVNGVTHALDLDPTAPLIYVLSVDLELRGDKFGCGLGQCASLYGHRKG